MYKSWLTLQNHKCIHVLKWTYLLHLVVAHLEQLPEMNNSKYNKTLGLHSLLFYKNQQSLFKEILKKTLLLMTFWGLFILAFHISCNVYTFFKIMWTKSIVNNWNLKTNICHKKWTILTSHLFNVAMPCSS